MKKPHKKKITTPTPTPRPVPDLQIVVSPVQHRSAQLTVSHPTGTASPSPSSSSSDNDLYENSLSSPLFTKTDHHPPTSNTTATSKKTTSRASLRVDTIKLTPTRPVSSHSSTLDQQNNNLNHIEWQHDVQYLSDDDEEEEEEDRNPADDLENHLNGTDESEQDAPHEEELSNWNKKLTTYEPDRRDDDEEDEEEEEQRGLISPSHQSENGEREPLVYHDHNDPRSDAFYSSHSRSIQPHRRHSKARQRRKVYGGGRADWGGELEIWEVGLGVASNILSPAPLFIPHAFLLLGLPIGLPILFLIGFLAWFSQVVLVVCGRYVGGRTYAQVASSVLPDRLKGCNVWLGESIVELFRVFVAGGRGMVNMMMVSDLFSQLTRQYTPKAAILYSRVFIIALVGLLSLLPNFVCPRRPIFLPALFPTLSRLPLLITILWPISIGIIAFRLRQLNRELGRKLPPTGEGDVYSEIMGGTVWGGFSILLFCLTTPQHTFTHLRSLKRINKPPRNTLHPMKSMVNHHSSHDGTPTAPVSDPLFGGSHRSSIFSGYTIRRYSWESAALLGVTYSVLICFSWGMVGYLGMEHGGYEVNFLASLPSNDPWISSSRVLLLLVLIPSIPLSLRPATTALFHLLRIPGVMHKASSRRKKLRRRGGGGHARRSSSSSSRMEAVAEWDDEDEDEPLVGTSKIWAARLVTSAIWLAVAVGAIMLGGSNGGEGSTIEVLGCVGSTVIAGLLPAAFWIVLFHIRKARPILNIDPFRPSSSPSAAAAQQQQQQHQAHAVANHPRRPGAAPRARSSAPPPPSSSFVNPADGPDQLLIIKEAQLQKRLSGRRIWQDIAIFGLLMPFCLVVLLKGLIAVSHETGPPPPTTTI
ncbi:hypothetical protein PCASD_08976 [Puccinia coronata f. sp. avenae]|uniref:Amino acid transporter transmembrane domain-containing protein n=2 Tax=Puccinia coronata f. sp. avenae TaxID=200324 RepID=A0A2N5UKL6_9BASI|nr:hypothetical protein PCASD_08976 [Puccinia coronata f. sp. avenae]